MATQTDSWGPWTTTQDGAGTPRIPGRWSYQADITGTGAVSATVVIQVRNISGGTWQTFGTITLSGTGSASGQINGDVPWVEHRARLTAISGTGAAVTIVAAGAP